MIIDIYSHVFPRPLMERLEAISPDQNFVKTVVQRVPQLFEFDNRFRLMDEAGDYVQIISLASPPIEVMAAPEHGGEIARLANDSMAELVDRHPDRFPGFVASLSLADIDGALAEADRAIKELGARGVQIFTDVAGRPLDDPAFDPLFGRMAEHGLPIWMHPTRGPEMADYATEERSLYDIWLVLGWPFATSVAMMRLVHAGLFERHPGLKVITHHMGGMIPYHEERVAGAMNRISRQQASDEGVGALRMRRPPMESMRMFYADTAMHGAVNATLCGIDFFGAGNVVFASDAPFGSPHKHIDMIDRLELDDRARHNIIQGNAERLMQGAGQRG